MFKLFKRHHKYFKSLQINPPHTTTYTLLYYQNDIARIIDFYHSREHWVRNKNILSRILRSMNLNIDLDIVDFIMSIDSKIKWVSRHYNLASPVSHGKFHDKDFYIEQELYDDYFSLPDWRELTPIYPIYTDYRGLRLSHPQDMKYQYSLNYLDIKALAIQYYYWIRDQHKYERDTSIEVFISQYPLSNMIPLYANLSIIQLAFRELKIDYPNTHSVNVYDRTNELKKAFRRFRKAAKNKPVHMDDFMKSIPLLGDITGLDYIRIPLPNYNNYNFLPYFFIYARYIWSMNNVVGKRFISANANELSDLNILLRYYRSTRSNTLDLGMLNDEKQRMYDYLVKLEEKR